MREGGGKAKGEGKETVDDLRQFGDKMLPIVGYSERQAMTAFFPSSQRN
jgi:hypothetical protein